MFLYKICEKLLKLKGYRSALKDLVKVIQQESYTYRDPITEFLEHLYVNFDFDGARQKLQDCQTGKSGLVTWYLIVADLMFFQCSTMTFS